MGQTAFYEYNWASNNCQALATLGSCLLVYMASYEYGIRRATSARPLPPRRRRVASGAAGLAGCRPSLEFFFFLPACERDGGGGEGRGVGTVKVRG